MQSVWLVEVVALGIVAAGAALARRRAPAGSQRRNVLSVVLVIACLVLAFVVCFGFGAAFREMRGGAPAHALVGGAPRARSA